MADSIGNENVNKSVGEQDAEAKKPSTERENGSPDDAEVISPPTTVDVVSSDQMDDENEVEKSSSLENETDADDKPKQEFQVAGSDEITEPVKLENEDNGSITDKTNPDTSDTAEKVDETSRSDKGETSRSDKGEVRRSDKEENIIDLNSSPPAPGPQPDENVEGASSNGNRTDGNGESIHQIKWVYFKKKQVPIITQNENGPCPLLALINVLLLQNRVKLTPQAEIVSASQLMAHLGDCVLQSVPGEDGVSTPSRLNFEQNMGDAMAVMYKLQTGLDVNVRFTGVRDFEYTSECIIFDLLHIPLYHGWLVDPQNSAEVSAVGNCSYNRLVEKIIGQKTSDQPDLVSQALVAEQFLESSASQLTYHGLSELCIQLKEDELAVLFRNNHFTTLYKYKGELFQLVTDQGFLHESNVVWETLSNVEGDCHFVDSEFRTYRKPEPPPLSTEPPNVPLNTEEQIDHDYMVALSLQQEQQQQPAAPSSWQPANLTFSDEELARQLQEEERQAAIQEEQRHQGHQGHQGQSARQQGGSQQSSSLSRRPNRQPNSGQMRDEKKSDCCIL